MPVDVGHPGNGLESKMGGDLERAADSAVFVSLGWVGDTVAPRVNRDAPGMHFARHRRRTLDVTTEHRTAKPI